MKKIVMAICLAATLALAGCSSNSTITQGQDSTAASEQSGTSTQEQAPAITIQVDGAKVTRKEISDSFKTNEIAAKRDYIGKPIVVTTEVYSVTSGPVTLNNYSAENGYIDTYGGFSISINKSGLETVASLKPGDEIRVTGIIDSYDAYRNAIILLDNIASSSTDHTHYTKIEKL